MDPLLEKLLSSIKKEEAEGKIQEVRDTGETYKVLEEESEQEKQLILLENSDILMMRKTWSNWVLRFIGAIVVFDMLLVWFYGVGIWSFKDTAVVIAVITDNFLKILALGLLITSSLFKRVYSAKK